MKNRILIVIFSLFCSIVSAQYATANAILDKLEERSYTNQDLSNESIDEKKFVLIKDFKDHTDRNFLVIKGKAATYIEMSDDKKSGNTVSKVYSGDYIRTKKNVVSFRFDKLEGKKIPVPTSKTLLLRKMNKILYLLDLNSKERWIDETMLK